jgi:hypothetical protein
MTELPKLSVHRQCQTHMLSSHIDLGPLHRMIHYGNICVWADYHNLTDKYSVRHDRPTLFAFIRKAEKCPQLLCKQGPFLRLYTVNHHSMITITPSPPNVGILSWSAPLPFRPLNPGRKCCLGLRAVPRNQGKTLCVRLVRISQSTWFFITVCHPTQCYIVPPAWGICHGRTPHTKAVGCDFRIDIYLEEIRERMIWDRRSHVRNHLHVASYWREVAWFG